MNNIRQRADIYDYLTLEIISKLESTFKFKLSWTSYASFNRIYCSPNEITYPTLGDTIIDINKFTTQHHKENTIEIFAPNWRGTTLNISDPEFLDKMITYLE